MEDMVLDSPISPVCCQCLSIHSDLLQEQFSEHDADGDLYSDVQHATDMASAKKVSAPSHPKPISNLDSQRLTGNKGGGGYDFEGFITRQIKRSKKWKVLCICL